MTAHGHGRMRFLAPVLVVVLASGLVLGPTAGCRPGPGPREEPLAAGAEAGLSGPALATAAAFFEACRAGDQATVESLLDPRVLEDRAAGGVLLNADCSFLQVTESSPWDLLLWRDRRQVYTFTGEPVFDLRSPGTVGVPSEASVAATYEVWVTYREGEPVPYAFREEYVLTLVGDRWRVAELDRSGAARRSAGDTAPDGVPTVTRRQEQARCGPFAWVGFDRYWDPSGGRIAFSAGDLAGTELWVVDADAGSGGPVLTVTSPDAGSRQRLILLGWAGDGGSLLVLQLGQRAADDSRVQWGWWVRSVPTGGGPPKAVAFVPEEEPARHPISRLTSDGRTLFVYSGTVIYRVDLDDGRVTRAVEDVPDHDGLLVPCFSPDGWSVAWWSSTPVDQTVRVADFRRGVDSAILPPPSVGWVGFEGWTPDGLVRLFEGRLEDLNEGPDLSRPAGYTALAFYDTAGSLKSRLEPPGLPAEPGLRLGDCVWAPDGSGLAFTVGRVKTVERLDPATSSSSVRVHFSDSLWVWNGKSAPSRLVDLGGVETWVEWPAPTLLRVHFLATNAELPALDLDLALDGSPLAANHVWREGQPEEILGGYEGTTVAIGRAIVDGRWRQRVMADGPGGTTILAKGHFGHGSAPVGQRYLCLTDEAASGEVYLLLLPLPGRAP